MSNYSLLKLLENKRLENIYQTIIDEVSSIKVDPKFAPPLLLREFDAWSQSKSKLMFFGQETLGWEFYKDDKFKYYDWPFQDIRKFADILVCENGAQAYSRAYEIFDFSKHQPDNYRSPFWRMHRGLVSRLENNIERTVIWNNLFKMAYDGGTHLGSDILPADLLFSIEISKRLIHSELDHFTPKACVFFTGPNYDFALRKIFDDIEFQEVGEYPSRYFSKVKSRMLPENSFRTYHPAYLNRTKKFNGTLELLVEVIKSSGEPG